MCRSEEVHQVETLEHCLRLLEQLQHQDRDLHKLFSEFPLPMMALDEELRIKNLNRKFVDVFGYTMEDIPTLEDWLEVAFPEAAYRRERRALWEALQTRSRHASQDVTPVWSHVLCKDGSLRTVEAECTLFGKGCLAILIDLTDKLQMEQATFQSEERLRSLVNSIPDGIILFDEEGRVVEWNPHYARDLNIPQGEIPNQKCWDIQFRILPESQRTPERYDHIKRVGQHFLETGEMPEACRFQEVVLEYKEGERRFVQLYAFPIKTGRGHMLMGLVRDVTQERLNEAQLEQYQKQLEAHNQELRRFSQAIKQSGSTIVITDPESHVVYANPKFEETTGYTVEEVLGKDLRFLQSGELPRSHYKNLWSTLHAGLEWRGEFHNRRKDGSLYWEYATIAPICDHDGNVVNYIAVKEDITARKQAESEIQLLLSLTRGISEVYDFHEALETSLRLVGEHTGWVFGEAWLPDRQGILLKNSLVNYLRYPDDEKLQRFARISAGYSFPKGIGMPGRIWASGEPEWQHDISTMEEETYLRAKFSRLAGLRAALGVPIIVHKTVLAVLIFYMDRSHPEEQRLVDLVSSVALQLGSVLQHKRIEEENLRLTIAVEQIASTIVITDKNGTITYVNPKFTQLTGYTAEEAIGQNPRILKSKTAPLRPEEYRHLWQTILSGQSWHGEFCNQRKNGELFWESAVISPIRNLRGEITHFMAIKEDITARKKAEEQLCQYAAILEEQNAELDAFAHTVAHDLRNPLTIILGFSQTLASRWPKLSLQTIDKYLRTITQNARRMNNIIDELLLLAGVRGLEGVEIMPLSMSEIVTEAIQRLVYMSEEYRAEIIVPDVWPIAMGYGPWVLEVWTNYISNAMKYGGKPPYVELGATEFDHEVRFWVKDNGPGLTEKQKSHLFVPFQRFHQARAGGHGLGLSIVRRIVEKLGGSVGVEDAPEGGCLFYFTLPKKT